jgi:ATP-dependent exoDNAse (exonuclease V) beta subunit
VLRGSIDLLVERAEEAPLVVDYKTDRLDRHRGEGSIREHFASYRPQLREYAAALRLLGVAVSRACVISARSGETFDLL